MTSSSEYVDSKAELTALLEQWEKDHGSGQDMVPILTRYVQLKCILKFNNTVIYYTILHRTKVININGFGKWL